MALSTLADATDMIPLLDDNGSGAYIKGRNTADDIRKELLAALFDQLTTPFDARPGVLSSGWWDTSNDKAKDLLATPQGSPNQQLTWNRGRVIVVRSGHGPYLISFESDITATMPAADGTNPRIDVVYTYGYDKGAFPADAAHGPKLLVETGTPASSPTVPSIPSDAVAITQVFRRTTGATPSGNVIQAGDLTDRRKSAGLRGYPRFLMPADLLADVGGYHHERRARAGSFVDTALKNAGAKVMVDYWDAVNATWRGESPGEIALTASLSGGTGILNGANNVIGTLTVPDPGYPYRLRAEVYFRTNLNPRTAFDFKIRTGGSGGTHQYNSGQPWTITRNGDANGLPQFPRHACFVGVSDNTYTGATALTVTAESVYEAVGGGADLIATTNGLIITVVPV